MVGRGVGMIVEVPRRYRFSKLVTVVVVEWRICKCIYYYIMYRQILINIDRCVLYDMIMCGGFYGLQRILIEFVC